MRHPLMEAPQLSGTGYPFHPRWLLNCGALVRAQGLMAQGRPATSDPSWIAPLTLLARAYNIYNLITGEEEMYRQQVPLPLSELYSAAAPQRGLLALLKHALWQTLWVEGIPPGALNPKPKTLHTSNSRVMALVVAPTGPPPSPLCLLAHLGACLILCFPLSAFQNSAHHPLRLTHRIDTLGLGGRCTAPKRMDGCASPSGFPKKIH